MKFYNPAGRVVGLLTYDDLGEGWLVKRVKTDQHQLHTPLSWCVDQLHLTQLREADAAGVLLTDERGWQHRASLDTFTRHGFVIDRGHGKQVALPITFWEITDPSAPKQLGLFD